MRLQNHMGLICVAALHLLSILTISGCAVRIGDRPHLLAGERLCADTRPRVGLVVRIHQKAYAAGFKRLGQYNVHDWGVHVVPMDNNMFCNGMQGIAKIFIEQSGINPVHLAVGEIDLTLNKFEAARRVINEIFLDKNYKVENFHLNGNVLNVQNVGRFEGALYYLTDDTKHKIYRDSLPSEEYDYFVRLSHHHKKDLGAFGFIGVLTFAVLPFTDVDEEIYTIELCDNKGTTIKTYTNSVVNRDFVWLPLVVTFGAFSTDRGCSNSRKRQEEFMVRDLLRAVICDINNSDV
jgi:uncharacterized ubiquitin-like protein YukD